MQTMPREPRTYHGRTHVKPPPMSKPSLPMQYKGQYQPSCCKRSLPWPVEERGTDCKCWGGIGLREGEVQGTLMKLRNHWILDPNLLPKLLFCYKTHPLAASNPHNKP